MKFEPNELVRIRKVGPGETRPGWSEQMFSYIGRLVHVTPYHSSSGDDYTAHGYIWKETDFEPFPFTPGSQVSFKKDLTEDALTELAKQNVEVYSNEKYEIYDIEEDRVKVVLKYKGRLALINPDFLDASSLCAPPINPNKAFKKAKARRLGEKEAKEAMKYGWGEKEVARETPRFKMGGTITGSNRKKAKKIEPSVVERSEEEYHYEPTIQYMEPSIEHFRKDDYATFKVNYENINEDKLSSFAKMYGKIEIHVPKPQEQEQNEVKGAKPDNIVINDEMLWSYDPEDGGVA
jgi:hypothetical protein